MSDGDHRWAVFPAIMGYISDLSTLRHAFLVPFLCHLYVLYFPTRGYRPALDLPKAAGLRSISVEN
jgi:fucose permease